MWRKQKTLEGQDLNKYPKIQSDLKQVDIINNIQQNHTFTDQIIQGVRESQLIL